MPSLTEWKVPAAHQPDPSDYSFDLDRVLSSVVGLHSIIPADAFSEDGRGLFLVQNLARDVRIETDRGYGTKISVTLPLGRV